ncbi:MAG: hypothetical protein VX589_17610 [Myxococcota bacterium]|nr:hypothetical protein [Myxococcota bacterium]
MFSRWCRPARRWLGGLAIIGCLIACGSAKEEQSPSASMGGGGASMSSGGADDVDELGQTMAGRPRIGGGQQANETRADGAGEPLEGRRDVVGGAETPTAGFASTGGDMATATRADPEAQPSASGARSQESAPPEAGEPSDAAAGRPSGETGGSMGGMAMADEAGTTAMATPSGGMNTASSGGAMAGQMAAHGGGSDAGGSDRPGVGGAAIVEGCSKPVYDLTDGLVGPNRYRINGRVKLNTFEGSCAANGVRGADALIEFTAPIGGEWRFSTRGSDLFTVFYALTPCDAEDVETQLVCVQDLNADALLEHSEFRLFIRGGERVFLVVDRYASFSEAPFTVTAEIFTPGQTPRVSSIQAFRAEAGDQIGMKLTGTDEDTNLWSLGYTLWQGEAQVSPRTKYLRLPQIQYDENGGFTALVTIALTAEEQNVVFDSIRVHIVDERNAESNRSLTPLGQPDAVDPAGGCDDLLFRCGDGELCAQGRCIEVNELVECGADVRPLTPTVDEVGRLVVMGNTVGAQGVSGSCLPRAEDVQVVRFDPPTTGSYFVAVEALGRDGEVAPVGADPVLMVRRFCASGIADELAELACFDRPDPEIESRSDFVTGTRLALIRVAGEVGVPLFFFVGGRGGWRGDYRLRVIPNVPATNLTARLVATEPIALRVSGRDIDPVGIQLSLVSMGMAIDQMMGDAGGWTRPFDSLSVLADGTFTGYIHLPIEATMGIMAFESARISVYDAQGNTSDELMVEVSNADTRMLDQACDIRQSVDRCTGDGIYCVLLYNDCPEPCGRVAPTQQPAVCRAREGGPEVTSIDAYTKRNALTNMPRFDLTVIATDLDGIDGYRLEFFDESEMSVFTTSGRWDQNEPEEGGGRQLRALVELPALRDLTFTRATLQVRNVLGLYSTADAVDFQAPRSVGAGEACDSVRVTCNDELVCVAADDSSTCRAVEGACADDRGVQALDETVPGAFEWATQGILSPDAPMDAGTCAPASATLIYEIVHTDGGQLTCTVESEQFAPVSWIRWACPESEAVFELSCESVNISRDETQVNTNSVYVPPNRPIYMFVGAADGGGGAFRLNCRPTVDDN